MKQRIVQKPELPHALAVDDEPQMLHIVTFALENHGFTTKTAQSAESAWQTIKAQRFDLLVLDIMLPGRSGIDLLHMLGSDSILPVLVLSARSDIEVRLEAFEAGAEDYLVKPFHPRELALRAKRLVSRATKWTSQIEIDDLKINTPTMTASIGGRVIALSGTEFRLLRTLAENAGTVMSWREILQTVWSDEYHTGGRDLVKTVVYRVRTRIAEAGADPGIVQTVRGAGYVLSPSARSNARGDTIDTN